MKVAALVVVCVVVAGAAFALTRGNPTRARVGDCLAGQAAEEIEIVKCGDDKAAYRVVGKIDRITREDWDGDDAVCGAFPTAESSFWEGEKGAVGYALCLETIAR